MMSIAIGRKLACAVVGICAAMLASPSFAQEWPTRPIRVVIGFGAGGGTDIVGRIIAQPLSEVLGQPVIIENKPGGGGLTGAESVAKGPKDGYTAFFMNSGH